MSTSIRLATEEDASCIFEIYALIDRDTHVSFELEPPTRSEMALRILATCERYAWLVCSNGTENLGYSYASNFRSRPAYQWTSETTVDTYEERIRYDEDKLRLCAPAWLTSPTEHP